VWAVPEGEACSPASRLLRVTAPLIEAQVVETKLLNLVGSQTMIASKAARVALACGDRRFVEFGARRTTAATPPMQAARSAWIGGASGTSLVSAGVRYGVPLSGTMAHSFVMSFDDERDAFRAFARRFPGGRCCSSTPTTPSRGPATRCRSPTSWPVDGVRISGVRLDSGDLARLSRSVRHILDEGGLSRRVDLRIG
jgi:nicotinate phosphoribosyltransferase